MQSIIIVGGGSAGLMAACELASGYKIIILEASENLGGRIRTVVGDNFSMPVELGAEFVHGKLPVTLDLLDKASLKYYPVEGKMYYLNKGQLNKENYGDKYWSELLNRMKELKNDMPLSNFLEQYFSDDKYEGLRNSARGFAEGFDLADVSKVSTKSLFGEWSHEEDVQFRIDGGYRHLIMYLESECKRNGCEIYTNCVVKKINWKNNEVDVETADGSVFKANKIIVTVPLHILQSQEKDADYIEFSPSIDTHIQAAKNIGFGAVIKIILEFDEAFWQTEKKNVGFIFTSEKVPTWWTQLPYENAILTGWLGSSKALQFKHASQQEIVKSALESLSSAFNISFDALHKKLLSHVITDWSTVEHICGGYSYNTIYSVDAKKILNQPVNNTVYFAGEALYEGISEGTVEAALISGKNVAVLIRKNV